MNSPLVTAVVGTAIASPRPKARLTPMMAMTIATATSAPTILRLLARHMSLHRHTRLEARRYDNLVIICRTDCNRPLADAIAVDDADGETVLLCEYRIARQD